MNTLTHGQKGEKLEQSTTKQNNISLVIFFGQLQTTAPEKNELQTNTKRP